MWFIFQKTKYVWNEEAEQFEGLQFPINNIFRDYMEWKGYQEDSDIAEAEVKYGKNM